MNSTTTMVATQYRLQEWAEQIKSCNNRPSGMKVEEWCAQNSITKANYYYRLRRVREACLEIVPEGMIPKTIVPVPTDLIKPQTVSQEGLDISVNGYSLHVTESTSLKLLSSVLEVIRHTE
jgi:hypothetical protein